MPSRSAAAASRSCSRRSSLRVSGKARVKSRARSSTSIGLSFQYGGGRIGAPEGGDAVGCGTTDRVGAAADDVSDIGMAQPGQVVVGDGLFLLRRQSRDGIGEVAIKAGGWTIRGARGHGVGGLGDRYGAAGGRAGEVDGFAVGDGDQPRLDVGVGRKVRVGLHRGQERLRPRVVSVCRAEYGPADPQYGSPVLRDDRLKWLLARHVP